MCYALCILSDSFTRTNFWTPFIPGLYSNEIVAELSVRFKNDLHCTKRQSNAIIIYVIFGFSGFEQQPRGSCIQVSNIDFSILTPGYDYIPITLCSVYFIIPGK